MLEALGMPLTNMVTKALPAGKLVIGSETKELVCQLVADRNRTFLVSMLRN